MGILSAACSSSDKDCIRLTPSSRRCANAQYFAEPPPPAPSPAVSVATSSGWTLTTPERAASGEPTIRETVWVSARPPFGAYDFIALRRITSDNEVFPPSSRLVFLFLPGSHLHGEIIFPTETLDLRLYLAKRGIETWTLDYRTHFVPREQLSDSSFMQAWTTEAFIEDVVAAMQQVREQSGQSKIFVGGFSRGATFAGLAAARTGGEGVRGLVLLDGYVLDPPDSEPLYRERTPTPNWFADDLESHYLPYKRWIKILQDVIDDPSGPDFLPDPVFASRAQSLAHFFYTNASFGGRGGFSNAQNGKADVVTLAQVLRNEDRYWPRVQNHGGFDFQRHLADARFDYRSAFLALHAPLLAFSSDRMDNAGIAWSEHVRFTAYATRATDVQFRILHEWGHVDVLWGTNAVHEVFAPITQWIVQH
jgi:pimeloyl-ACP methyl ester carboxylesterase